MLWIDIIRPYNECKTYKAIYVNGVSREGIELEKERLTGCEKKERQKDNQ